MDVETILSRIRERVLAGENAGASIAKSSASSNGSAARSNEGEALKRISDHLTVTGRAWNQLPPVFSNRSGTLARLELWIKNFVRPLTRWFIWEQVNFNAATHHALLDVLDILVVQAHELRAAAERDEQIHLEIAKLRETTETSIKDTETALSRLIGEFTDQHSQLANKISEVAEALLQEQRTGKSEQDQEMNRRLADLAAELKEAQRVCFRQLSLEASESAILEDRGRRSLAARLEKLEKSLESRQL